MKDLQKRIEELEEISKEPSDLTDYGQIAVAKLALSTIKQLQDEVDKYKLLWESACEGAKAIIAELENENKCLKKQYEGALKLATNLQTRLEENDGR